MILASLRPWFATAAALGAAAAVSWPSGLDVSASTSIVGSDRLVSWTPLPEGTGALCPMPDSMSDMLPGAAQSSGAAPAADGVKSVAAPTRVIRDRYPAFSSIAIDLARDHIVVTDENLFQILFYDRTENNGPAQVATPKRVIGAAWDRSFMKREDSKTKIEFQCGLYVDPRNGEVYAVNNDTENTLVIFSSEQVGNVAPHRGIETPHGTFGITVDEAAQEVFLTIQHDNAMVVYRKGAGGEEPPLRLVQGERTQLADPHGVAFDGKRGVLYVTNHGSVHAVSPEAGGPSDTRVREQNTVRNWPLDRDLAVPGSGRTLPPSITVYAKNASGDAAPLRVIQGPKTGLNWPTGIAVDAERGDVYVANDTTDAILVFDAEAAGDAAPKRVLKGPKTGMKNPTGLALDFQHQELWVANFGNHTATSYRLSAQGDVAPLRTIRAAPHGTPSLMIGNPGAVAFDTRRELILTPN